MKKLIKRINKGAVRLYNRCGCCCHCGYDNNNAYSLTHEMHEQVAGIGLGPIPEPK